jgi:integrase
VLWPYVVPTIYRKARPQQMRAQVREHHTQVLPEQLSRVFADARNEAGIDADNPPTFHESRSLGDAMLQEAGWSLQHVQALMGHASRR